MTNLLLTPDSQPITVKKFESLRGAINEIIFKSQITVTKQTQCN